MKNNILTPREYDIFSLLVQNKNTRDISEILGISDKTVRNHISNVMQKTGTRSRSSAVVELIKLNELSIPKYKG